MDRLPEKDRYELWQHKISREIYAVRLTAHRVTGVIGPLAASGAIDLRDLTREIYEDDPDRLAWIQERGGEFLLLPPRPQRIIRLPRDRPNASQES